VSWAALVAKFRILAFGLRDHYTEFKEAAMDRDGDAPKTIDEYISRCAPKVRSKLERLRKEILSVAPDVKEGISYGMAAFSFKGPLAYFAAFEKHIGFYPLPSSIDAFADRLAPYKHAKGSVQFPIEEEPPYDLVRDIVQFRVEENERKAAAKNKPR
jgi:uncharacterized protein YdhG (YjbR/CyaY superfamily)